MKPSQARKIDCVDDDSALLASVFIQRTGIVVGVNKRAGSDARLQALQDAIAVAVDAWVNGVDSEEEQ